MAIAPFLAMTAAEISASSVLPQKIAWMACHFSPYGLGLSNLPKELAPGSLLIVDDITPPCGQDPALIVKQLTACAETFQCHGILLDFQRLGCGTTKTLAEYLSSALPIPTAVSEPYAASLNCPVFLPPVPPSVLLEDYLAPWEGREIWLELGSQGEMLSLTEAGCLVSTIPCPDPETEGFREEKLHCHYSIQVNEKSARFTLWRTHEDLKAFLKEAADYGITTAVALYQQLNTTIS